MSMTIGSTTCIGVVVSIDESELNSDFTEKMSDEAEEQGEDFYLADYLYDKFEKEYEIVQGGSSDVITIIIALKDTVTWADWEYCEINPDTLYMTDNREIELSNLIIKIKGLGLEVGESGILLVPYFSH